MGREGGRRRQRLRLSRRRQLPRPRRRRKQSVRPPQLRPLAEARSLDVRRSRSVRRAIGATTRHLYRCASSPGRRPGSLVGRRPNGREPKSPLLTGLAFLAARGGIDRAGAPSAVWSHSGSWPSSPSARSALKPKGSAVASVPTRPRRSWPFWASAHVGDSINYVRPTRNPATPNRPSGSRP